jgi:arsenate reductase
MLKYQKFILQGCKMDKKVLVMCSGNSCRSIIAEALINKDLDDIKAYSCGVAPTRQVNPNAKKILELHSAWDDTLHSKHLDEVIDIPFDLVVTVCDQAKESCPVFPKPVKKIHIGFEDPDGKNFDEFKKTYNLMKKELLPKVAMELK